MQGLKPCPNSYNFYENKWDLAVSCDPQDENQNISGKHIVDFNMFCRGGNDSIYFRISKNSAGFSGRDYMNSIMKASLPSLVYSYMQCSKGYYRIILWKPTFWCILLALCGFYRNPSSDLIENRRKSLNIYLLSKYLNSFQNIIVESINVVYPLPLGHRWMSWHHWIQLEGDPEVARSKFGVYKEIQHVQIYVSRGLRSVNHLSPMNVLFRFYYLKILLISSNIRVTICLKQFSV